MSDGETRQLIRAAQAFGRAEGAEIEATLLVTWLLTHGEATREDILRHAQARAARRGAEVAEAKAFIAEQAAAR